MSVSGRREKHPNFRENHGISGRLGTSAVMFQRTAVVDVSDEAAATAFDRRLVMKKAERFGTSVSHISSVSNLTTLLPMLCLISAVEMQPLISE